MNVWTGGGSWLFFYFPLAAGQRRKLCFVTRWRVNENEETRLPLAASNNRHRIPRLQCLPPFFSFSTSARSWATQFRFPSAIRTQNLAATGPFFYSTQSETAVRLTRRLPTNLAFAETAQPFRRFCRSEPFFSIICFHCFFPRDHLCAAEIEAPSPIDTRFGQPSSACFWVRPKTLDKNRDRHYIGHANRRF